MIDCQKARATLQELKKTYGEYVDLLAIAKVNRDYSALEGYRSRLKESIEDIRRLDESYLRFKIAMKWNADEVSPFKGGLAVVARKRRGLYESLIVVDGEGNNILRGELKNGVVEVYRLHPAVIVEKDLKFHVLDKKGNPIMEPLETKKCEGHFNEGLGLLAVKTEKDGYVFRVEKDSLIPVSGISLEVAMAEQLAEDIFLVQKDRKKYLVDRNLNEILKKEMGREGFQGITLGEKGPIALMVDNKWKFYSRKGKRIHNEFLNNLDAVNSLGARLVVRKGLGLFLLDDDGGNLFKGGEYEAGLLSVQNFTDGVAKVKVNFGRDDWAFIDSDGCNILKGKMKEGIHEKGTFFFEGRAFVMCEEMWYVISPDGEVVSEICEDKDFESADVYKNGFARIVYSGGRPSVLNKDGKDIHDEGDILWVEHHDVLIPDRILTVRFRDKWYLIDRNGKSLLRDEDGPVALDEMAKEVFGMARAKVKGGYVYFDRCGKQVFFKLENE